MSYNFNKQIQVGKFDIQVDALKLYGFFEHEVYGDECGGGLWFEHDGELLTLADYDGVFELPKEVWQGLEQLGFLVAPIFKDEEDRAYGT